MSTNEAKNVNIRYKTLTPQVHSQPETFYMSKK